MLAFFFYVGPVLCFLNVCSYVVGLDVRKIVFGTAFHWFPAVVVDFAPTSLTSKRVFFQCVWHTSRKLLYATLNVVNIY